MTVLTADAGAAVRRRPGRPRDEDLDGQIVAATLEIIDAGDEVTVSRVVARSGVSRAALYRRWPSLTLLIAAALDVGREVPPEYPADADLHEILLAGLGLGADGVAPSAPGYSEERFRQRIRLVMADRALQRTYWESHVSRRRVPLQNALRVGMARSELRSDLDVEACFDAIAGVAYYQLVVRGDRVNDPAVVERMRAAIEVIWRGMVA
ncbi:TetR/AcrR family transcriptional regulator [Microbacterium sp. ISL-59]|uniref:TetR/AcrR family transcriptional regulator C-terminal ligand-binding domain-containing protein n=1 Tax=Microbacterium sp. ISL-59 TaxID=2819159 RepID=UPI001BE623FB|nr:TetR/AcrR family transcriptional regulator C-terminal ligand-binding domain-containing protein [Microbacterium sp. ISL-59]MBT2495732.1 TetR/AcrR family transcriptional regulator [Microbacterium sp. ISL-59]